MKLIVFRAHSLRFLREKTLKSEDFFCKKYYKVSVQFLSDNWADSITEIGLSSQARARSYHPQLIISKLTIRHTHTPDTTLTLH